MSPIREEIDSVFVMPSQNEVPLPDGDPETEFGDRTAGGGDGRKRSGSVPRKESVFSSGKTRVSQLPTTTPIMSRQSPLGMNHKISVTQGNLQLPPSRTVSRTTDGATSRVSASKTPSLAEPRFQREFTFTGYDIMQDESPKSPAVPEEDLLKKTYVKAYREMCRRLGIVPVSYLERRLCDETVRMPSHGLGVRGTRAVAVAFVANEKVKSLDISDNAIGCQGACSISQMLSENTYLTSLDISDNQIGFEGSRALCDVMRDKDEVKVLRMAGNILKTTGAAYVQKMLQSNICLRELDISRAEIGDEGAVLLGKALAKNNNLEVLNLSWNHVRSQGAAALANGLKDNRALHVLDLSWNGFGDEGCVRLGEALKRNRTLQDLDLSSNRIGSEGVAALMKELQKNQTLVVLKLSQNPLTPEGASLVLQALSSKTSRSVLNDLYLQGVTVHDDFIDLLAQLQESRPLKVQYGACVSQRMARQTPRDGDNQNGGTLDSKQLIYSMIEWDYRKFLGIFEKPEDGVVTKSELKDRVEEADRIATEGLPPIESVDQLPEQSGEAEPQDQEERDAANSGDGDQGDAELSHTTQGNDSEPDSSEQRGETTEKTPEGREVQEDESTTDRPESTDSSKS